MNKELNYGIEKITYGYSKSHALMFNPVGEDGENITILVLSCNRIEATKKLLSSIKECVSNYKGDILIIDNNSFKKEKEKLKEFIKEEMNDFNIKLIELDENKGVAGGRNYGINFVNTEWVFSLDNDIYFTKNPFFEIYNALSSLGCHFLNLSLLNETGEEFFADGGHLYIDTGEINIGGGSLYKQASIKNNNRCEYSLSTFLFGGCSIFKVSTFKMLGEFDSKNFFVGFEDTDFSIRIFRAGYKIGNCHTTALIHNHSIPVTDVDNDYEKIRFSYNTIETSASNFEKKWNFKVWNANLEMWLFENQKKLGIIDKNKEFKICESKQKYKIALVVDTKGWAFWNIAEQIKKNLSDYYDFDIIVMDYIDNIYRLIMGLSKYDHIHFFWRGHLSWIEKIDNKVFNDIYGISYDYFYNNYVKKRKNNMSTSVYDHLFINNEDEIKYTNNLLSKVCNYTISSNKLNKIYNELNIVKKPCCVINDGVDLDMFKPINLNRFKNKKEKKLIIGWVGNSTWNGNDNKGVNTILKPALEELKNEGYNIETYFADRQERMIPHDKMCEYYSNIDVLICTSSHEGTPNPILEAMACGIPIISTDVGIVQDVFGKLQKNYILQDRTIKCLKEKILDLYENFDKLYKLSEENINSIKKWDWKIKTKEFKKFFDEIIQNKE